MMQFRIHLSLVLIAAALGGATARAADLGPAAKYLADDVVAVASVDLTRVDFPAALKEMIDLGLAPGLPQATDAKREAMFQHAHAKGAAVQKAFDELPRLGARRLYLLLRYSDLQHGGPTWALELAEDAPPAPVIELLKSWLSKAPDDRLFDALDDIVPTELGAAGNVVLGARSTEQMAVLKKGRGEAPREDATPAMEALLAADAGFVAFGDADSRRVVREMLPQLPAPFMEIDGKLLADGLSWCGVLLKLPPGPTASITIQAASDAAAHTFEESAAKGLGLLKGLAIAAVASGETDVASALPALALLKPERDGTRLSITLGDDADETAALRALLGPAVAASRDSAQRMRRVNNLKQIALAMLNYDSAKGSLPPAAIYDADGKPLLSWRVQILPFFDDQASADLYHEFHLDEPWDSEHNRALIAKMPEVYADPGEPGLAAEGRTTFLVPTGPGTLFDGREGTKWGAVKDGTANTILVVEVTPERSVPWTKPEDWEVDLADPLRGVKRGAAEKSAGVFGAAFCDGHVMMISDSIETGVLKAMLTIAGGEDLPQ